MSNITYIIYKCISWGKIIFIKFSLKYVSFGLDNALALSSGQVIAWTNDDQVH